MIEIAAVSSSATRMAASASIGNLLVGSGGRRLVAPRKKRNIPVVGNVITIYGERERFMLVDLLVDWAVCFINCRARAHVGI